MNPNLMLGAVLCHLAKQSYCWLIGDTTQESYEKSELADPKYVKTTLNKLKEELRLIARKEEIQNMIWAQDALEFHAERLADLESLAAIPLSSLEEIKLDILYLKQEVEESQFSETVYQQQSTVSFNSRVSEQLTTLGVFATQAGSVPVIDCHGVQAGALSLQLGKR